MQTGSETRGPPDSKMSNCAVRRFTRAAVESQAGGGVELLDEELRQRNPVICAQGLIAAFPVQHQVFVGVRI